MGYAGVSADVNFLRRAEEMHRTRILPILRARMPKRWDTDPMASTPAVSCRLTTRRVVQWKQMYASLWPDSFRAEERARRNQSPTAATVVYASRIELCAD